MLATQNLGKSFAARTLFEGVSLQLGAGSRYGLVGANGSGKSTFLRILAGDDAPSDGGFSVKPGARMSVLRQDRFLDDDQLIRELVMQGDWPVWQAIQRLKALSLAEQVEPAEVTELEEQIRMSDGHTLEGRASAVLEGLGIPGALHLQPLRTLSGGFKLRVLLAQVLLGGPDLLLLDEPTNHLDILSIRWLETFLARYQGCALIISHDQRFLDAVATHTLDVDYQTITLYTGNYSRFAEEKRAIRERKEAQVARAEKQIAEKRAFVERFGAKATKAKQAQSRLKQIEKIEVEELATSSRRTPYFKFEQARPSGRDVLELSRLHKAFGEKVVLKDVSLTLRRGERLAVIGPNGLGKSTLLKLVMGRLAADSGAVRWGHETRAGYFAQDHAELLVGEATPLDFAWAAVPTEGTATVRGALGRVLFSGEDVQKPIALLSGGEAARLVFCRLMLEQPNVLVLDEPTNHLDLESIHALAEALERYEGTLLFVSHDRWFVSRLATRVLELTPQGPQDFPGTYEEYLARAGADHLDAAAVVLRAKQERAAEPGSAVDWAEQKRRRNRLKELPRRRDEALAAVEAAEARQREIHALYASPGFFERAGAEELARLQAEEETLRRAVEERMAEWEALEEELAGAEREQREGIPGG